MTTMPSPARAALARLGLSLLIAAAALPARAETADDLFSQVMRNPDDVALNLAFGEAAEREGNPRHALAAYERASRANPSDGRAYRAYERLRLLLSPPRTAFKLTAGGDYRSNARQAADGSSRPSDATLDLRIEAFDERTLSGMRLRSNGHAAARLHVDEDDLSEFRASGWTGPVYRPSEDIELHGALGGGVVWLDDGVLYTEASGRASATFLSGQSPQTVSLYGGFRDVRDSPDGPRSDGYFLDLSGQFALIDALAPGDGVFLQPRIGFSEGTEGNGGIDGTIAALGGFDDVGIVRDAVHVGGRVSYFHPVLEGAATAGAGVGVRTTFYDNAVAGGGKDRRDTRLDATLHLVLNDFIADNIDLRFDYRYEHNDSNDPTEDFDNHVIGSRIVWDF